MTTEAAAPGGDARLLKHGRLRLLTDATGSVGGNRPEAGLYAGDTRYLSALELLVGGARPVGLPGTVEEAEWGDQDLVELAVGPEPGLRIERSRRVDDRLVETLALTPGDMAGGPWSIELRLGFDAADIFEVRGYPRAVHGELLPPRVSGMTVRFAYLGLDSRMRMLDLSVEPAPSRPIAIGTARDGRELIATVEWSLEPGQGTTTIGWTLRPAELAVGGRPAALAEVAGRDWTSTGPGRVVPRQGPAGIEIKVDDPATQRVLDRSLADLDLLTEAGPRPGQRLLAAGLPWFAALFGRDSLLTAYEAIAFRPDLAVDALAILAERQAGDADTHGGEPGQILHELRTGEMARLGEVPFGPSFGSVDATPLWLVLLGESVDWLDDRALLERLWPAALRALAWIDARLQSDSDGFLAYNGRPGALANEGWKDSPDAVRDRDGAIVPSPIALAEVQGYVYDAWRRIARLARRRGQPGLATRLNRRAVRLRARFDTAFWSAVGGFPPMAIGRDGRLADAVASNIGQCLWTGILGAERADAVAARILAAEMDSGWGIRTLAASEPAFEPLGYHTGSVWPHDSALIAGGLKRAGFDDGALRVADHLLEAAMMLPAGRLPELISGAPRIAGEPPELVPQACPIQAWASAAPLHLVRVLLGLQPAALEQRLVLRRPQLPSSVDAITIRGLAVGRQHLDLEVRRDRQGVRARVVGGRSSVQLVRLG